MCFYTANNKRALAIAKRYGLKTDIIEMAKEIIEEQKYRTNAFTHPTCPIVTTNENLEVAQWGLIPHFTKTNEEAQKIRKMCLNARSETVFSLPSFRVPIISQRCLIPVTGYFEFHHENKMAIPYYIYVKDEEIFSLGGMYELWQTPATKETAQTFTIITVPANPLCAHIHNGGKNPFRMPLIIPKKHESNWLDRDLKSADIQNFFHPFDDAQMDAYPISKEFLKKSPDDASIIERAA